MNKQEKIKNIKDNLENEFTFDKRNRIQDVVIGGQKIAIGTLEEIKSEYDSYSTDLDNIEGEE